MLRTILISLFLSVLMPNFAITLPRCSMKSISKFCFALFLLLTSTHVFALSKVICKEDYYLEKAAEALTQTLEQMPDYSVSAPTNSVGPGGHHAVCVTVTKVS